MSGSNYFSHDSNARNSAKLLNVRMKHGAAGYGVYFMLLERLRAEQDYVSVKDYNMIAFDLRVDAGIVKSVVEDFGLFAFTEDGERFYSESLNRRMSMKDSVSKARSDSGRRGAEKRWADKKAEPPDNGKNGKNGKTMANAINSDGKESKVKKEKESVCKEKAAVASFSPPTHTQVSDFAREEGLVIDAASFIDYNAAKGWMMGSSPMRDWKAAARKWAASGRDRPKPREMTAAEIDALRRKRREEAHEADMMRLAEERKRITGIYEGAKAGKARFVAIVKAWAENGTLAKWGLPPIDGS